MEHESLTVAGPGGRTLEVRTAGERGGLAVLYHVGTPNAGRLFEPLVAVGAERGLWHVTYSRPGYGASERRAGRTVADCVADVSAVADVLGMERFLTFGWSGGGPHALACAALLPERTLAAATVGSVAPREARGLDWLAGMGPENVAESNAAEAGPQELLAFLEPQAAGLAHASGADLHAAIEGLLSDVDRGVLSGDFAEYMSEGIRAAVSDGVWGWYDDDLAFMKPWGFELDQITRPVTIWQGREDRFVPYAHGEWLVQNVAGARGGLLEEHGHLSIPLASYANVLDELLAATDATSRS